MPGVGQNIHHNKQKYSGALRSGPAGLPAVVVARVLRRSPAAAAAAAAGVEPVEELVGRAVCAVGGQLVLGLGYDELQPKLRRRPLHLLLAEELPTDAPVRRGCWRVGGGDSVDAFDDGHCDASRWTRQ